MPYSIPPFQTIKPLPKSKNLFYYALPELAKRFPGLARLPVSIRIMLESLLRCCDGKKVTEEDIERLCLWSPEQPGEAEIPFTVSRVILQDFTGVPLLVDLAAMRDAAAQRGFDPAIIEPQVPVDLVIDHSVQVDAFGSSDAFLSNLKIEFERNRERYEFLKWGQQAFKTLRVIPTGIGIVHQVNLEHLATVVATSVQGDRTIVYPDTLVGTDSHTTMINGLGILGWGVGGIEAEAAMLGQPVCLQMPEVIGVHLSGSLREGATATDLTLRVTQLLRKENVVGKFVEFYGSGAASLTVADRATIANMAPEYGATTGFFPADEKTLEYLRMTGRSEEAVDLVETYLRAQGLFGIPKKGEISYTKSLELDLGSISASVSGPKRPQDLITVQDLKEKFTRSLTLSQQEGGYGIAQDKRAIKIRVLHKETHASFLRDAGGKASLDEGSRSLGWSEAEMVTNRPITHAANTLEDSDVCDAGVVLSHGSVVIAAITSCTNTSNPSVMFAAGLLAKKAVKRGLKVGRQVKTSLAPGSRVVTDYLEKAGLQRYLDALGFQLVAYGCTTCIGNSGPLNADIEKAIKERELVTASVLSGNRNFEARIHSAVKANFLMSPPLVVAFALAGRIDIDLTQEPIAFDAQQKPVYLKELWPSEEEIAEALENLDPEMYKTRYSEERIYGDNPVWKQIKSAPGLQYQWDLKSTYIQKPPYFDRFSLQPEKLPSLTRLRPLALFGDSVTTDHISPAGAFSKDTPAGKYLMAEGVDPEDFNSYGSRRGNHHVMMRGTFANVRIRNLLLQNREGGFTKVFPEGKEMSIFDACTTYAKRGDKLIVFAGKDYGMGSSRDWAAKGSILLGVRVVVAKSFERIHRSNLIGMGVLPLEFEREADFDRMRISGEELFDVIGIEEGVRPKQKLSLRLLKENGSEEIIPVRSRIDTPIEVDYYLHGGIMPFVLRQTLE